MSNKTKSSSKTILGLALGTIIMAVSFVFGGGCGSSKEDYAKEIERVYNQLEMYESILEEDDIDIRERVKIYTITVNKIDVSDCPCDFRKAYKDYAKCCEDLNQYLKDAPLSTFEQLSFALVHLFDGKIDKMLNNADDYSRQVYEISAVLNSIASKYGVVFDKDGNVIYSRINQKE